MRRLHLAWMRHFAHRPGRVAFVPLIGLALLLGACAGIVVPGQWAALSRADEHVVLSLADDPFDPNIVYAGTAGGLVYRAYAKNGSDGAPGPSIPNDADVAALAADPVIQQTIYAGTSDGLYVSTDRGEDWQPRGSGLPSGDTLDALIATKLGSPPGVVLFAGTTAHGVLSSADGGRTWAQVAGGLPPTANINTLFWEPSGQTLYTAADGIGVFASADGGHTWSARNTGLSTHTFALVALPDASGATAGAPLLLAGTDQGVFSSADGGQHWAPRGRNFADRVQALATDPQHPTWLYAGTTSDVVRSEDGGVTWGTLAPGINHAVSSLLTVAPAGQQTVVYAGAGPLQRYPPYLGNGNGQADEALGAIALVVLLGAIFYVFYRTRRMMVAADRSLPVGLQEPERPRETEEETASGGRYTDATIPPATQNGHGHRSRGPVPGGTSGGEQRRRTEDGDGDRGEGRGRPSR
jgi:photosystem II stability/assembly factor-like uncharacterized protein